MSTDNESPPMIFKETIKLLESMESNEEHLLKSKCVLEHKQTYHEQLLRHENDLNRSIAEKQAGLSIVDNRAGLVDTKSARCRDKGKQICVSCNAACQDINDINASFAQCEVKIEKMGENLNQKKNHYDNKIDELIKLLDLMTEKRKKKLENLKLQEEKIMKENLEINNDLQIHETKEQMFDDVSDDDSDSIDVENDFKILKSKLSILDENFGKLNKEGEQVEVDDQKIGEKFNDSVFEDLKARSAEINKEIPELLQGLDMQKAVEEENVTSFQELKDYEKNLDQQFAESSKSWDEMDQNQYGGFSKLEQEIGKIRADIVERNEKYGAVTNENSKLVESLKKKENEIEETSAKFENTATELKEVEKFLENLKTTDDLSRQYEEMCRRLNDLDGEKASLENIALEKDNYIQKAIDQLKQKKAKADMEFLTSEHLNSIELGQLEKQCTEVEATKTTLDMNAKETANKMKELEKNKKALKEKSDSLEQNQIDLDKTYEDNQRNLKLITMKKGEVKMKLSSYVPLPPIQSKRPEHAQDFTRPKTPEPVRKAVRKPPSPKAKRNWDSDSSTENYGTLSDLLKKKSKRGSKKE